ncbi:MAG TPA: hypothetical protein VHZ96_10815, partial [Frankiaceae bacterium]|nr:hypothetical protein [Frankiaceae bacterium]
MAAVFGWAGSALAASVSLCVPASGAVTGGACTGSGTTVALPSSATDQQTLISLLPYLSYTASGIGGKPTIKITGANMQIVNGSGSTTTLNGTGNLVLGYDETPGAQTGSHDLVLGEKNSYTGYSELLDGLSNTVSGGYGVAFGYDNTAVGLYSTVTGGAANRASGTGASVTGGEYGIASGSEASVA